MKVLPTTLPGVVVVEPQVFGDDRGFFFEAYQARRYAEAGIDAVFVQDNYSRSLRGTLRGLHFQEPNGQGKLVSVVRGAVFDVAVDVRRGSPHFGQWYGTELDEENRRQMWVPAGFAHGFCVLSDVADFVYKCTELYVHEHDRGIAWDDPAIGIAWPVTAPLLSVKDQKAPRLADAPVLPELSRRALSGIRIVSAEKSRYDAATVIASRRIHPTRRPSMRMMMKCSFPVEAGNKGITEGTLPKTVMAFMEQHHPEAAYFIAEHGKRTALFFFDMKDSSMIPSIAEPFMLQLHAEITLVPAMNAEDMKAGVERVSKQM